MAERGALERAHVRLQLIRELAAGEVPRGKLAKRYGVAPSSVTEFAHRHAARIAEVQSKLDDEYAGLWIAAKANRLAEYQQQVDYVADLLADDDRMDAEEDRGRRAGVNVSTAELMRTAQSALKAVAEELGQLPNRMSVQHDGSVSVRYEVVGVAPEDLR